MPEQPGSPEPKPEDSKSVPADVEATSESPEAPAEGSTGRARFMKALVSRPTRGQALVAVLLAAVGFAATTQVQSNERDDDYTGLRQSDLIRVFDGLSGSSQRADAEIQRLTGLRDDLRTESSSRQAALDQARNDAQVYGILAGTLPASGPGVRITIEDPEGRVSARTLLDTIQELRAAGAEVIEFNERVRLIAQSDVVETVSGIEIDGRSLEAPYVIDVIGEPNTLAGSLDFPGGPTESVAAEGGSITFEELDQVVVESVVDESASKFASPRS
ncbi:uncharacterized protein YlxW (UPF0749 family) [Nocardioides daedukensis]|uniref:Uncharacterized protein YlxW (UPF0749 family) n=1 Tax=Nocardioides daedukensis TaxID=634462 RepID=A0A7Y9RZU8_9ACTN|nr:DUF881 domain-containing protein [Nocardioides daedukensis]NYG57533.1 uncharacterized protein YlxW (UPF0749 family) [Nocardioides daedukensis]